MNNNQAPQNKQNINGQPQRVQAQGQRPMQGQPQRVQAQGQRPMQGQPQRVQAQGQRPLQGQPQRPQAQGQNSMQGQPQRPQAQGQNSMQGQPQRVQAQGQRPAQNNKKTSSAKGGALGGAASGAVSGGFLGGLGGFLGGIGGGFGVVLIATALLLALAIVGGTVAATAFFWDDITAIFEKDNDIDKGGNNGDNGGSTVKPKPDSTGSDKTVVSANISLPSQTPSGNYLSTNVSSVTQISGISSNAAALIDMDSNKIVAGINADTRIYPASMTKVMTLLVACENAEVAGKLLTVTQNMVDYKEKMGASGIMGFEAGEQISVEDALYLINYNSDTIACLLVAEYISGSEAEFVKLMNKKATELGLKNTHFTNTTGLHDPTSSDNTYTTCREMAAIMNAAMNNEIARKILTAYSGRSISVYRDCSRSREGTIYAAWYSTRMKDTPKIEGTDITVIGGKTGYEDIPTGCFVTVATDKSSGKNYICVTVGRTNSSQPEVSANTSTEDTKYIYKNYADS